MKILNISITCVLILNGLVLSAQQKGALIYKVTYDNKLGNELVDVTHTIYFEGNKSVELIIPKNLNKDFEKNIETVSTTKSKINITINKPYFIYKDFDKSILMLSDYAHFRNVRLIKDTLNNFKWTISNEKQMIANYNCVKATTNFRGRKYEVWFTSDVSLKNGPWKFCGLPGLIVKASDSEKMFCYELLSVNMNSDFDSSLISIPKDFNYMEAITHGEFMKIFLKMVADDEERSKIVTYDLYGNGGTTTITHTPKIEKY